MGIGSFFASLFQKEEDSRKEIRELDIEPVKKTRASESVEDIPAAKTESTARKPRPKAAETGSASRKERQASAGGLKQADKSPEKKDESPEASAAAAEKKAYFQGKKDLYYFLNQCMKTLYEADRQGDFESLAPLDGPSDKAAAVIDRVKEELPEKLCALFSPFVDEKNLQAPEGLKEAFTSMLLPFYPVYRDQFGEFSYNTFLNRDALDLFRRLTGRKYRLGYRNRYASGQAAFEWKGDRYKIYDDQGTLLCDAVFEKGAIKEGYAVVKETADAGSDWSILRKGTYKEGTFTEDTVEYIFARSIDSVQ